MRSSFLVRFAKAAVFAAVILVGALPTAIAQEATPEAFTSEMMQMNSSCPQNIASTLVEQFVNDLDATEEAPAMDATEAPSIGATQDMSMMTEEAPAMDANDSIAITEAAPDTTEDTGPLCIVGWFAGDAEVPGPGDDDGLGLAFVTFDSTTGEVCYEVAVANITLPANAMHIHVGAAGESGGVVIPFPTAPDEEGAARGCTTAEDMAVLEDLAANPEGYYVNVHTSDFPDGAVRAQLMPLEEGRTMLAEIGIVFHDLRGDTSPESTLEPPPGS